MVNKEKKRGTLLELNIEFLAFFINFRSYNMFTIDSDQVYTINFFDFLSILTNKTK